MGTFTYRKKPVEIQAYQLDDRGEETVAIPSWFLEAISNGTVTLSENGGLDITTLEGVHHASPGDYVIRGVKGELYPCKPDIFELTYDKV